MRVWGPTADVAHQSHTKLRPRSARFAPIEEERSRTCVLAPASVEPSHGPPCDGARNPITTLPRQPVWQKSFTIDPRLRCGDRAKKEAGERSLSRWGFRAPSLSESD